MSTVERLAKNSAYSSLQTVWVSALGLVSSAALGRLLGPAGYGDYAYFMWLVGVLAIIAAVGLPHAATHYVARFQVNQPATARLLYRWLVLVEFAVAGSLALIVAVYALLIAPASPLTYLAVAIYLIPLALARLQVGVLAGAQAFRETAVATMLSSTLGFPLVILVAWEGWGTPYLILAHAMVAVFQVALFTILGRKHFEGGLDDSPRDQLTVRRDVWGYARVMFALAFVDMVVWQKSEVLFLRAFSEPEQIAFYSLAFTIAFSLMQVPAAVSNVLLPYFSASHGGGQEDALRRGLQLGLKFLALLVLPSVCAMAVVAAPLIQVVYGDEFAPTVYPLLVLLATSAVATVHRPAGTLLLGVGRQSFFLKIGVVMAGVNVALDFLLIPRWGAVGAAWANGAVQVATVIMILVYVGRVMGHRYPAAGILRVVLAAVAASATAWWLTAGLVGVAAILAGGIVYAVAYVVGLRVAGAVTREEGELLDRALSSAPGALRTPARAVVRWVATSKPIASS